MDQAPPDTQEMARAAYERDLPAIRRILARKPNLSDCLDGYNRVGGDEGLVILKMLLEAGADINDPSGGPLLHTTVDVIADVDGSRYDDVAPDWTEVGQLIELGADPHLLDDEGRNLLEIAEIWGDRISLNAYLKSLDINLE